MSSVAGKVIAITGAASGIGLATAEHLASLGARLSLTDSSAAGLENAGALISKIAGSDNVFCRVADVRDRAPVDAWIQDTVQLFGRLDGAVNAAGVLARETGVQPIWNVTDDDWQFTQDINVKGTLNCVRAQLKHMVSAVSDGKKSPGSIVVLGSNSSLVGASNLSAYTTSKHALVGLTRAAAMDAAPYGVRVNIVCPGPTDTPMLRNVIPKDRVGALASSIPLKRLGEAGEIAGLVTFLLSDEGAFCTGGVHSADGGITAA